MSDDFQKEHDRRPAQHQPRQPGKESQMRPEPVVIREGYKGSGRLEGRVALITGGDSGIGRSVAVHYAREGANVALVYLDEHEDAQATRDMVLKEGRHCLLLPGDISDPAFCEGCVDKTVREFGRLDILVNNAAEQHVCKRFEDITPEQVRATFSTNIFPCFDFARAAVRHLEGHGVIINTTSVTAYRGSPQLIDYSATKGAIVAFTRSLAKSLVDRGIRVNAVAPGPIWTPLIPATFEAEHVDTFGEKEPEGRAGQPAEVAPCYVFLASEDASYMIGQVLHPNGGGFVST